MTYTHLTTNELVMIEAYYQENIKVSDIVTSLGRSKQTIYTVINYLKEGHSAYDYYNRYKINKKRCGRNKTSLTQTEKDFIQTHLVQNWSLDVIKGTYPDRVSCSMRTLYRLADRGILKKEDLPWKGKRKPNGHSEKRGKAIITLKINGRKASVIEASINQWLSQVPSHLFKSITFDCGKEFSKEIIELSTTLSSFSELLEKSNLI